MARLWGFLRLQPLRAASRARRCAAHLQEELQPQGARLGRREHILTVHGEARSRVRSRQAGAFCRRLHVQLHAVLVRQLSQRHQVLRAARASAARAEARKSQCPRLLPLSRRDRTSSHAYSPPALAGGGALLTTVTALSATSGCAIARPRFCAGARFLQGRRLAGCRRPETPLKRRGGAGGTAQTPRRNSGGSAVG